MGRSQLPRELKLGNAYELDGCTLWLYAWEMAIRIQRSEPIDSCKNRKQNFVEIHQSIVLISSSHGNPSSRVVIMIVISSLYGI